VQLAAAPAFTPHKVGKLACSMNTLARLRGVHREIPRERMRYALDGVAQ